MSKDIKKKILDAIAHVRKNMGFTLVCEDWGDSTHKCACALGCVIAKDDPTNLGPNQNGNLAKAAGLLGVTEKWADAFIEGYDGNGTAAGSSTPEAWKVGEEVRKETKPIVYHEWDGESE